MNVYQEIVRLYEKNRDIVGVYTDVNTVLAPVYHLTQNAHLTVVIDGNGDFLRAEKTGNDVCTVVPVTRASVARTSNNDPRALCDYLWYVAGDYMQYADNKSHSLFVNYVKQLEQWAESEHSHPKVKAILTYVKKESMVRDILSCDVLALKKDGKLAQSSAKSMVRFRVEDGSSEPDCWKDRSLQEVWIAYRRSKSSNMILSAVTGRMQEEAKIHQTQIRFGADMTKVFTSTEEDTMVQIGEEDSFIFCNTLRWLCQKNRVVIGKMTFLMWSCAGGQYPDFSQSSAWVTQGKEIQNDPSAREVFNSCMRNKQQEFDGQDSILFIAMESAMDNKGGLVFTRTGKWAMSEYLHGIWTWYERCGWLHPYYNKEEKRAGYYYGVPGIRQMARILYGTPKGTYFELDNGDYNYVALTKALTPCIMEGKPVPQHIIKTAVRRVTNMSCLRKPFLFRQSLAVACSLIKQGMICRKGKEYNMELDIGNQDRSYLFGRLLAVADMAEKSTFDPVDDRFRETNALKSMHAYISRPAAEWQKLRVRLEPYLRKIPRLIFSGKKIRRREYYENMIGLIMNQFSAGDFNDVPLEPVFLIGYDAQKRAMAYRKEKDKKTKNEEENKNE